MLVRLQKVKKNKRLKAREWKPGKKIEICNSFLNFDVFDAG